MSVGHKVWCLPDLYLKEPFLPSAPSHESVSVANFGAEDAFITVTIIFEDDTPPLIVKDVQVKAMRSARIRTDEIGEEKRAVPVDTPYSMLIKSTQPIVVGYGRLNWIEGHMQSFGIVAYHEN